MSGYMREHMDKLLTGVGMRSGTTMKDRSRLAVISG